MVSPYNVKSIKEIFERPTLEQMLTDFNRSSMGMTSQGRSSVAKLNKVVDLDLNSIEFNTPPRE